MEYLYFRLDFRKSVAVNGSMAQFGALTPTQTAELLNKINHIPNKKLGQNFLVDSNIVRKSLELAKVENGDYVVEVGPGLGTLSGALVAAGANLYAVELDSELYSFLSENFGSSQNFHLLRADAVDKPLADLPENCPDFKIVANLPYAISTPWLDAVLCGRLPSVMSLMLQKEAAQRFTATSGSKDFSPISIFLCAAYNVLTPYKVSQACFYPRPRIDSVLLPLRRKAEPYIFDVRAKRIIREIFSKRRKQIGSIAKASQNGDAINSWIECAQLSGTERPETVHFEKWKLLNEIIGGISA